VEEDVQQRAVDAESAAIIGDEPQLAEFVHEKLTRERVVPIISAGLSWLILAITAAGFPSFPRSASSHHGRIASALPMLFRGGLQ
jgi:hypothetical protein